MLKINGFYGNPYVKDSSYQVFANRFSAIDPSVKVEDLGVCSDGTKHLYGLQYGDVTKKPVIFVEGNCHGSEWWAAHFVLDFFERIVKRDFYDKKIVDALADTFAFYVIPSTNPWGYETTTYYNFNGVNLNRNTDVMWDNVTAGELWTLNSKGSEPFSEPESKIVRNKVQQLKPYMAVNCHTSHGAGSDGIDVGKRYTEYKALLFDCFKASKISLSKFLTTYLEWSAGYAPTWIGWYGQQTSKEGRKTIPSMVEMRSDQNLYNYGLTTLLLLSIYAMNYYKGNPQTINSRENLESIVKHGY